jgi:voltage-gated potassium channel
MRFCLQPLMLVDIITVAALVPALRGLRALRLLRLARTARMFRYSKPFLGLERAFQDNAALFTFAFSLLGCTALLGGVSIYLTEVDVNPTITTLGDGIWWAVVTLTTVGFGDISPVTSVGRVVGAALMVAGLFNIALFAGVVGHTLLRAVLSVREEQLRMSGYIDHVVICGYDAGARMLLDAALLEVDPSKNPIVIFAEGDRPTDVPPELVWISGDPTKESELDKVRLADARAAILVGSRAATPQHADATTILTAFTIRSYLARQAASRKRHRKLYLVAEILDSENVQHALAAGADEVIETTRLGFSLMAHAIVMPGTAAIAGGLATTGANSLFVGRLPEDVAEAFEFGALSGRLRVERRALLLGVRNPDSGEDLVNPPDDHLVTPRDLLIYLAEAEVLPRAGVDQPWATRTEGDG